MEAAAALREDGKTTEEAAAEGTEGLSLGFGCGSPGHLHRQPHHKHLRSDAFPFRVAPSSSHGAAAGVSTASDGRAAGPPPSPARTLASPLNGGVKVGGGGGSGTAALGHGGISDSADSYGTPRALRPVNSPVTGFAGDATLQLCSYFTAAQWQELHRQALIFKCFVTATPVPPDLLPARSPFSGGHPFFSNLSRGGDYLNLRFTGANADLEPGRCRRTDGKKWRCSREVAPGQKYCERHVHRARPRSRKPVELAGRADPAAAASAAETVSTAAKPAAARPSAQSSPAGLPTSGADDLKLPFQFLVPEDRTSLCAGGKKLTNEGEGGGRVEVLNLVNDCGGAGARWVGAYIYEERAVSPVVAARTGGRSPATGTQGGTKPRRLSKEESDGVARIKRKKTTKEPPLLAKQQLGRGEWIIYMLSWEGWRSSRTSRPSAVMSTLPW